MKLLHVVPSLLLLASKVSRSLALSSRSAAASTTTTPQVGPFSSLPSLADFDYNVPQVRLPYKKEGYGTWTWRGHKINYLELGNPSHPPLLLIHGFGASAYHFRHNIPNLAADHHVYAMDMLGFGASDKPVQEYSAEVWKDQALDFINQVIQRPTVVAGNSLGGFTALYAAADDKDNMVKGCISFNGAGRFRDPSDLLERPPPNPLVQTISTWLQRVIIAASFVYTKQPARIEQVLRQVYPVNTHMVDSELVQAIQDPSFHPDAGEVFYRVITKTSARPSAENQVKTIDDLLEQLNGKPLLLCWGESDPWIRSAAADKIQLLYPTAQRVSINAGHCPHDEAPEQVNEAIRAFVAQVTK